MKTIRIGNDFVFAWAIERNGIPEDLSAISNASLNVRVFNKIKSVPFQVVGNSILIEFTPLICDTLGVYNLEFSYDLPDTGLSDLERKCSIDIDAFQIAPKSAMADDSAEFVVTSDLAIAFKGDKGDPFTFEDFTSEQLALLKGEKGDPFTFDDFTPEQLAVLKGEKGDSAYQIWPDAGNIGTEEDFLSSLKGEKGDMADVSMTIDEYGNLIATIYN